MEEQDGEEEEKQEVDPVRNAREVYEKVSDLLVIKAGDVALT